MDRHNGYKGKRALDVFVAFSLLALSMPVCALIAFAIKIFSGSPVIYHREMIGLEEKPFCLLKFRSMVNGAEAKEEKVYARTGYKKPLKDSRVTGIGRLLRKTSLDELPQFINVLRDKMSLVGPRPMPEWAVKRLPEKRKQIRFSLLPGITGLAQIEIRELSRLSPEFSPNHEKLEREYFQNCSLRLDCKILLKTILVVISGQGAY